MDELSAVWVMPHARPIEGLFRTVEALSVFPGGFGLRAYDRGTFPNDLMELTANDFASGA